MEITSITTVPQFKPDHLFQKFLTISETKFLDILLKIITGVVVLKTVAFTSLYGWLSIGNQDMNVTNFYLAKKKKTKLVKCASLGSYLVCLCCCTARTVHYTAVIPNLNTHFCIFLLLYEDKR
jgi:hypothetical protein